MPRDRRAKLVGIGGLFVLMGLVAAILAAARPGHGAKADPAAHTPRPNPPAASRLSQAGPARVAAAGGPTIAASGGGPGARVEDLSALTPVQAFNISGVRSGPVRIGAVTYADSVRFTCDSGGHDSSGDLDYVVTGYGSMSATVGVPSDDTRAVGDIMNVSIFNNGSGPQTSQPFTVSPGHPQRVHLSFRGASQLEISCSAINAATQSPEFMDLALANATTGP